MTVWVLSEIGWNPLDLFRDARAESPEGDAYLEPGLFLAEPLDTVSLGIGLVLGTAGLPHILMRFFTVPDAKAARCSVMWAMVLIGAFYVMTTALGFGARAILGEGGEEAAGRDRQPRAARPRRRARWRAVPRDHRRRRVRDDPGGRGGPRDLGVGRGRARRVVEHRPQRPGLRARGGLGRQDRRGRDRRDRDRDRDHRRRGPERLVHGRPCVRGRGQRQLPGAAARAHLAALQHHRRGHRRAVRRDQLGRRS